MILTIFIMLIATIFDLPTLITLIGGLIVKTLNRALLLAVLAATLGTIVHAFLMPNDIHAEIFLLRIIGQLLVAFVTFSAAQDRRTKKLNKVQSNGTT